MADHKAEQHKDLLFHELVEQYGEELIRLAYLYVKDRTVAEDIIQDVFLKAYENIYAFKGQSSYKTYLYRITINRCYDYFRSWTYKNIVLTDTLSNLFQRPSNDSTEHTYFKNEQETSIAHAVLGLPIKYREVIILYYYQAFSIHHISYLLKCSENTVKTRLRRARLKLKKKLVHIKEVK